MVQRYTFFSTFFRFHFHYRRGWLLLNSVSNCLQSLSGKVKIMISSRSEPAATHSTAARVGTQLIVEHASRMLPSRNAAAARMLPPSQQVVHRFTGSSHTAAYFVYIAANRTQALPGRMLPDPVLFRYRSCKLSSSACARRHSKATAP